MLLLIDNYDSFTYNLAHYFGMCGAEVTIYRNDEFTTKEILNRKPKAIILSPGPCDPPNAGICVELIKESAGSIPLFGVCLGYQSLGYAFGALICNRNNWGVEISPFKNQNAMGLSLNVNVEKFYKGVGGKE